MKDPTLLFRKILEDAGVATFLIGSPVMTNWYIAIGRYPARPDRIILLNEASGLAPYPQFLVNFPSVQIMIRGNQSERQEARAKLKDCIDAVLGITPGVTVDGDVLQSVQQLGDVMPLGLDDQERPMFSVNFSCIVLPAPSALSHRAPIT